MIEELLKTAYDIVNEFEKINKTVFPQTINTFPFKYTVPKLKGITKYQWGKNIKEVKPSTLKYIIYYLHSTDCDIIFEATVALLYYYKVRKKNIDEMNNTYKDILHHYTVKRDPKKHNVEDTIVVYYISFFIGSKLVYKVGYSTQPIKRFKEILTSIKKYYEDVSVGDFNIHQLVQFDTIKQAQAFEEEAKKYIKNNNNVSKCKIHFQGFSEAFVIE